VQCGYGVLKIKFLALTHPINLHHRDDIYYMVLATTTILLHNMMVKEWMDDNAVRGLELCTIPSLTPLPMMRMSKKRTWRWTRMMMNVVVMTKTSKTADRRPKLCIKGGNTSMTMLGQKT
jgi:hypothetical protein